MNELLHFASHQFNYECLKIAREFRGLKKNELAHRLNISPSAITQFERGIVKPNTQTVAQLCLVLRFPASFFTQCTNSPSITHEQCHFRSLRSFLQIERRRMVAASILIGRIIQFLESYMDLPPEQISMNASYGAEFQEDIELAAERLRREWGLGQGPIDNVIHLLEAKGILVFRLLEDSRKLDAFSLWHRNHPFIFINSEKGSASRNRFDAAHELGHLAIHSEYLPGNKAQEAQANNFASAFLMPRETFIKECPRRLVWDHFLELKQRWKVSLAALVRRAKDLRLISEDTYRRANHQIVKNGWKLKEPREPELEMPTILSQAFSLLSERDISLSEIAERLSISEIDLKWLTFNDEDESVSIENSNDGSVNTKPPSTPNISKLIQRFG